MPDKRFEWFVLIGLLLFAGAIPKVALAQPPLPGGSYGATCSGTTVQVTGPLAPSLTSFCADARGVKRWTTLSRYDYCIPGANAGDVWNDNGILRCERTPFPLTVDGTY